MSFSQFMMLSERHQLHEYNKDYRAALITAAIANGDRDPKKRPKPFKPEDFLPKRKKRKAKPMYTKEQLDAIKRAQVLLGRETSHG